MVSKLPTIMEDLTIQDPKDTKTIMEEEESLGKPGVGTTEYKARKPIRFEDDNEYDDFGVSRAASINQ